jgi:capsular polysaccharide transport system permease protein
MKKEYSIFSSVVFALFLREVQTRFGTKKLGYLWAIIDPFTQIVMFSIVKMAISDRSMPGIDYPVFLATGFLAYNFFKAVMNSSMQSFGANKALFNYKQVKPIDTIFARFILEILILIVAFLIFLFVGWYIGLDIEIKDFNMFVFALVWLSIFSFGIGLLFAVISIFYETFAKIVAFISLPLFFLSGLMYTVDSLPQIAQDIVLYNPIIHFIEMIHGSYFVGLNTYYVDYNYMIFWTIIPLYFGLFFYKNSQRKIVSL